MKLMLLGSPGAGKGTQANFLKDSLGVPLIATGTILRDTMNAGSELGKRVKAVMDAGQLLSDDEMIHIVMDRLSQSDCIKGFILDGFPRTLKQAEALVAQGIQLDHIIEIVVPETDLLERLCGRWIHPQSGRIYNQHLQPPQVPGKDDITGEPLVQRSDDNEETVKKRLQVYHELTQPLIEYYQKISRGGHKPVYVQINGSLPVEQVSHAIKLAITPSSS
jgi:adenylate kinase